MKLRSKILIIAGSDSSGGAGIQADIKTATCLGVYASTAVTAVTIQNTTGVKSVVSIPANEIYKQIVYTSKDIKPNAVKIGMLHSTQIIHKVLKSFNEIKLLANAEWPRLTNFFTSPLLHKIHFFLFIFYIFIYILISF